MAKVIIDPVLSSYSSSTKLNANLNRIATALENTLSRDGTSPNEMLADIDLNSNQLINVGEPTLLHNVATKEYVDTIVDSLTGITDLTDILGVQLTSIATLQAKQWLVTTPKTVFVTFNHVIGDGGGTFHINTTDTTSIDNNGTILVDGDGNRWYRQGSGPIHVTWFAAPSTSNNFIQLQKIFTIGGEIDLDGQTWYTGSSLVPNGSLTFVDNGTLKPHSSMPTGTAVLTAKSNFTGGYNLTINGYGAGSATVVIYGIKSSSQDITEFNFHGTIEGMSFDGINLDTSSGAHIFTDINLDGIRVIDSGWNGINLNGPNFTKISMNHFTVTNAGFSGVFTGKISELESTGGFITKADEPPVIYAGPGSLGGNEGGFLWGHIACSHFNVTSFEFKDSKNAATDGIGLSEGGGDPLLFPSTYMHWQGSIIDAGGSAFDVTQHTTADLLIKNPTGPGLLCSLDLGGSVSYNNIKAVIEDADNAIDFHCPVTFTCDMHTTNGSPNVTITNIVNPVGDGGYAAIGMYVFNNANVSGAGDLAGFTPSTTYITTVNQLSGTVTATLSANATSTVTTSNVKLWGKMTWIGNKFDLVCKSSNSHDISLYDPNYESQATYSKNYINFISDGAAADKVSIIRGTAVGGNQFDGMFIDDNSFGSTLTTQGNRPIAYTPVLTTTGTAITTQTPNADSWYKLVDGRTCIYSGKVAITTKGSASGDLYISLPKTGQATGSARILSLGLNSGGTVSLKAAILSDTVFVWQNPWAGITNGDEISWSIAYETA